jgi:hypothetical protein
LWVLIDKALTRGYVLSPLAAPHHRRDGLVFRGPSDKGKHKRPSPGGGRGNPSLTYEQSRAPSCPNSWIPLIGVIRQPEQSESPARLPELLLPVDLARLVPAAPEAKGIVRPVDADESLRGDASEPTADAVDAPPEQRSRRPAWGRCPMFSMLLHGR